MKIDDPKELKLIALSDNTAKKFEVNKNDSRIGNLLARQMNCFEQKNHWAAVSEIVIP
ncbi:hypothetical protein [Novipirellula caenicola]|uniref:hypothetical protein n=1 Tax=Novipirellula caenicola TaxID=1536901 RepID=UPI0031E9D10F